MKKQAVETCDTNVYQYEETSETLHWHLTRFQPLLRDNAVQIGCRLQSRGHCILNKLHKCPAICCLPPYHPVFVNVQMLKHWLMLSPFFFGRGGSTGSSFIMQFVVSHGVRLHSFKCKLMKNTFG